MTAVNEQIVTGRKFRKLINEATKLWQRISFWTKASDVEFDDGNDAETKMGAINGITDSLMATSSNVALSAIAGKNLQEQINDLNELNELNGTILWENPNISATFAGQTINLDLADFRRLSVVFKLSTTINEYIECTARKGIKNTCNFPFSSGDTFASLMVQRYVSFSDDYISISNTMYMSINIKPTPDNRYCIPVRIYGYKFD